MGGERKMLVLPTMFRYFADDNYAKHTAQNLEDYDSGYNLLVDKNDEAAYNVKKDSEGTYDYEISDMLWQDKRMQEFNNPPSSISSSFSSYKNHGDQIITP